MQNQSGPKKMTDIMIIAPCTGNTIAKLVNGITDTPVTMAAKSHLRNNNALVIASRLLDKLEPSNLSIIELLIISVSMKVNLSKIE